MTASTDGRGVRSAVMALCGVIVRPTATLCRISRNPAPYLAPSVAVFAAVGALGVLFPLNLSGHPMSGAAWDGNLYALAMGYMNGLLQILGIFWIGRGWGGNRSLRGAFPALAYCLAPVMRGIVAGGVAGALYAPAVSETDFHDGPSYVLDFALGDRIVQYAVGPFFIGWSFLLHVKAVRMLNGFGYARSIVILVLAVLIAYTVTVALGLAVSEFVL